MIDFPTFSYTSASKPPPFYIHEGQITLAIVGSTLPPPPPHLNPRGTFQEYFLR